jgi:hypothetical protein
MCCQVFRGIPGLSQQVSDLSPPLSEWRRFIYCESMVAGQLLGEVDHFPGNHNTHMTARGFVDAHISDTEFS